MPRKPKGKPKPRVAVIPREDKGHVRHIYRILEDLVQKHHREIAKAKIALAWRYGWRRNPDGHLRLGRTKKAGDLDRELHGFDFVILLNHEAWNAADFSEEQMRALLDHELCHCAVARKANGDEKEGPDGRPVWRIRTHDIQEFMDVVERNGCWLADLRTFAEHALEREATPLLEQVKREAASDPEFAVALKRLVAPPRKRAG